MSTLNLRRTELILAKFFGLCLFLSVGCAPNNGGSCPQSLSGNQSKTMNAVVEYSDRFCTAFVDIYKVTKDAAQLLVWTAGHCTPLASAHADKPATPARLSIADDKGAFFASVEIEDSFTVRNAAAKKLSDELAKTDPELASFILKTNRVYDLPARSICRMASDKSTADPQNQIGIRSLKSAAIQEKLGVNSIEMCFSTFEIAAMTVNVERSKVAQALGNGKETDLFWSTLTANFQQKSALVSNSLNDANMQANILKLTSEIRFVAASPLIDLIRWCKSPSLYQEEPIPNLPFVTSTSSCASITEIQNFVNMSVTEARVNENQKLELVSLNDYAASLGFDTSTGLKLKNSKLDFMYFYSGWGGLANAVQGYVGDKMSGETSKISVNLSDRVVSLNSLVDPSLMDFSTQFQRVFRFFIPKNKTEVVFKKGDSGSLLLFNGVVPLASLHAVDDDLTSGGAATIAIPRRQNGSSPSSGATSKKDQATSSQAASSGKSQGPRTQVSCN